MNTMLSHARAILDARECRYKEKIKLLQLKEVGVIEISVNVPGLPKTGPHWEEVFQRGLKAVSVKVPCIMQICNVDAAGYYALLTTNTDILLAKIKCCQVEEEYPWGRLLDIDCYTPGRKVTREDIGLNERRCLLCEKSHSFCIGNSSHPLEEIRSHAEEIAIESISKIHTPNVQGDG